MAGSCFRLYRRCSIVQFPITSTAGRLILCGVYGAAAAAALIISRRYLAATLKAPFADDAKPTPATHTSRPCVLVILSSITVDQRKLAINR
ncbi:MAG: Sodium/calcium exchanger protein [Mycobacterium sp.]|jgi:hypothetical protein|nr:Sodium/calcium exchanger protein [Mycobacterium sp.]